MLKTYKGSCHCSAYYMGRRCLDDGRQIKRWKAMKRRIAQIRAGLHERGSKLPKQTTAALLHWAYDSRKI